MLLKMGFEEEIGDRPQLYAIHSYGLQFDARWGAPNHAAGAGGHRNKNKKRVVGAGTLFATPS